MLLYCCCCCCWCCNNHATITHTIHRWALPRRVLDRPQSHVALGWPASVSCDLLLLAGSSAGWLRAQRGCHALLSGLQPRTGLAPSMWWRNGQQPLLVAAAMMNLGLHCLTAAAAVLVRVTAHV
jgi:hypothetical protein